LPVTLFFTDHERQMGIRGLVVIYHKLHVYSPAGVY
jgi:hypothetical protein